MIAGELQYREHLQWRYEATLKHREELRQAEIKKKLDQERAEQERLVKLEADRLKRLMDGAENHRRANDIRSFVASVIAMSAAETSHERVVRWQEWALAQADKIDPVTTGHIWGQVDDTEEH